jgi:hypothetical protein
MLRIVPWAWAAFNNAKVQSSNLFGHQGCGTDQEQCDLDHANCSQGKTKPPVALVNEVKPFSEPCAHDDILRTIVPMAGMIFFNLPRESSYKFMTLA